jgi:tRNA pseudouridine38-40 synthase
LERALEKVLDSTVSTSVAGRTDAGVHARAQVVSFEIDESIDLARIQRSLNGLLGPEISVLRVVEEAEGFSARFSATWRRYRYTINTSPVSDPLTRWTEWQVGRSLDVDAMRSIAPAFLGEHDFSSFCRSVEGRSNIRRLDMAEWVVEDERYIFWVRANAFCHQMVRALVGYSYDVGRGFVSGDLVGEVMTAGDRGMVATVAPPHGLVLWDVGYA